MNAYPATISFVCAFYSDHQSSPTTLVNISRFSPTRQLNIGSHFAFASSPSSIFIEDKSLCSFSFGAGSAVIRTARDRQPSSETPPGLIVRRLILLRHGESSWENRSLRDHDRPLSNAGQVAAAKVSQKLHLLGWIPELILSSDARRTKETLKIMQKEVPCFLEAEIHFLSSFYSVAAMDGQTAEHLERSICEYARAEILTVMCMGHNKGWEEAATMFSGASVELETCNAALLEANGESWEEAFSLSGCGGWRLQAIVKPDIEFSEGN